MKPYFERLDGTQVYRRAFGASVITKGNLGWKWVSVRFGLWWWIVGFDTEERPVK